MADDDDERTVTFEAGMLLGITLKRSTAGRAVVKEINNDTQAARNGVRLNDVVREVLAPDSDETTSWNLRLTVLDKQSWLRLVEHLKAAPRPLQLRVSQGAPAEIIEKAKKKSVAKPASEEGAEGVASSLA